MLFTRPQPFLMQVLTMDSSSRPFSPYSLFLFFMLLKEHLSQGHVCPKLEKPQLRLCSLETLSLVADWVEISKACQSLSNCQKLMSDFDWVLRQARRTVMMLFSSAEEGEKVGYGQLVKTQNHMRQIHRIAGRILVSRSQIKKNLEYRLKPFFLQVKALLVESTWITNLDQDHYSTQIIRLL